MAVIGQLLDRSTAYALFLDNQSSYRLGHSTETALVKVHPLANEHGQAGGDPFVPLDLSSAFDGIYHKILLEILETDVGIAGNSNKWISSFLSCRAVFFFFLSTRTALKVLI